MTTETAPITWLSDVDGNKCSVEYFGSAEAAQAALDSLRRCMAGLWMEPYFSAMPMWLRAVMALGSGLALAWASHALYPDFRK